MTTLQDWADDLRRASAEVLDEAEKVVSKGSLNIKNDWRARWTGIRHIPLLPYTVGYDIDRTEDRIESTIGPDKDMVIGGGKVRQPGRFGNIIEFGTVNNTPIPGGAPALDAEEPGYIRAAAELGEKLLAER